MVVFMYLDLAFFQNLKKKSVSSLILSRVCLFASCLNHSCPSGNYTVSAGSSVAWMLFIAVCFYKVGCSLGFVDVCATNRAHVPHVCPLKQSSRLSLRVPEFTAVDTLHIHLHVHTLTQTPINSYVLKSNIQKYNKH